MQDVIGVIVFIVFIILISLVVNIVDIIVTIMPYLLAGVGVILALYWLCKWLWTFTPSYKKRKEEELRFAKLCREQAEQEEREAEIEAKRKRKAEQIRVGKIIEWLKTYMIIVDTNVFMDAAENSDTSPEMVYMSNWFLRNIETHGVKLHILVSQLNELAHTKMKDDEKKKYKARHAQRKIERLQDKGLIKLLGDVTAKERYADVEIIKEVRRLVNENRRPMVITNDRDLKIRVNSVEGAACIAMPELFKKVCE